MTALAPRDAVKESLRDALEGAGVIYSSPAEPLMTLHDEEIDRIVELLASVVQGEVVAELDYLLGRVDRLEFRHRMVGPESAHAAIVELLTTARQGYAEEPPA